MHCVKRRIATETIEASLNWLCPVLHQIPISRTGAASYARLSTAISYQEARRRKAARKACRLTTESTGAAPNGGMRFGTVSSGNANGGGGGGGENVAQQPDAFKYTEEDRNDMRTMFEQYTTYERVDPDENPISCTNLKSLYAGMLEKPNDTVDKHVVVYGRVWSIRKAGSKLWFVDIMQGGTILQCVFNSANIKLRNENFFQPMLKFYGRGDVIRVVGKPHRTSRGEVSLLVTSAPGTMALCLHQLPEKVENDETNIRNRHVDLLLNPEASKKIRLRSAILSFLREFLSTRGFVDVQTPILSSSAGGAVARPFLTSATEFSERKLALRISPELWLKRLIVGGMDQVYEIGPSFRNEGIDMTHNPEFWTCEFYQTYTSIEELISMTEKMFLQMSMRVNKDTEIDFTSPFRRLDFITTVEKASGLTLPKLTDKDADVKLIKLMEDKRIPIPSNPSLPRLLDKLCSEYVEILCDAPTWIIHPPSCISPLAKSFRHDKRDQWVAARAELFVNRQEIVNTYEEENNPYIQRAKFEKQRRFNRAEDIDDEGKIDESYLQALEWGMPPTGGWGCGIERLCMLFSGTNRIADTLSFGTLRNVVSLANVPVSTKRRRGGKEEKEFLASLRGTLKIMSIGEEGLEDYPSSSSWSEDSGDVNGDDGDVATVTPNDLIDPALAGMGATKSGEGKGKGKGNGNGNGGGVVQGTTTRRGLTVDDIDAGKSRVEDMLEEVRELRKSRLGSTGEK